MKQVIMMVMFGILISPFQAEQLANEAMITNSYEVEEYIYENGYPATMEYDEAMNEVVIPEEPIQNEPPIN